MTEQALTTLKNKINDAEVISFDMFDTLVYRLTNTPEDIFKLVGEHFGIHGFVKIRMQEQNVISQKLFESHGYPHANMDEIYEHLADIYPDYDWMAIKQYEINLELDALQQNPEMHAIFQEALSLGKKVVITSDMYLNGDTIEEILKKCGYTGYHKLFVSSDERKAKFNKELFSCIKETFDVEYGDILHIGDSQFADVDNPASLGMETFLYEKVLEKDKLNNINCSIIDDGMYKILYKKEHSFWYNLGIEVGGPLYMGLYLWLKKHVKKDEKLFFLARDGYNLYHLCKQMQMDNIVYVETSRRALLLAGITKMDEEAVKLLPPYTFGQSVEEICEYLGVDANLLEHLEECGFASVHEVIDNLEQVANFKEIYIKNKALFLTACKKEREYAKKYFAQIGFFDGSAKVFDCGWNGSSQYLLDRFLKAVECDDKYEFYYAGILNSEKSKKQLRGRKYHSYLFDHYKNYMLQNRARSAIVLLELFFSAEHPSIHAYNENGVVYEKNEPEEMKGDIAKGIIDYVEFGLSFAQKYNIEISPDEALGRVYRLIEHPTEEEAVLIGNLTNADGFVDKKDEVKYIAYLTDESIEKNPHVELFWTQGLFARKDTTDHVKKFVYERLGIRNPDEWVDVTGDTRYFDKWINNTEKKQKRTAISPKYQPLISVVVPVYNVLTEQLWECIASVEDQLYDNWELILVDDCSTMASVREALKPYENKEKIHIIYRSQNGNISRCTNDGIAATKGEFIAFMDCDDVITEDALLEMVIKLNENPDYDFIYSDEDKLTDDGKRRYSPFFKPDWSPDFFMSQMYTNHLAIYRASIVKKIGGLRFAYDGAQDYDFTLRFMEQSDNKRVGHIPKILYHWRARPESLAAAPSAKSYALESVKNAKIDMLKRRGIKGYPEYVSDMYQYRVVYEPEGNPFVSIIIPSKDNFKILKQCIESVLQYTDYHHYEIIVVDNGSGAYQKGKIEEYLLGKGVRYIYRVEEFNFSKMCNMGAAASKGEYLLFLNDDIEVFDKQWLSRMVGQAMQSHTGAVGGKLMYPESSKLQHCGIVKLPIGPSHTLLFEDDANVYYYGRNRLDVNFLCVTAACLMVSKEKFNQVGQFDETFPIAYNDVDLCYKLWEAGYYNVIRNDVPAYHHESISRGDDNTNIKKQERLLKERVRLENKHKNITDDPFYNINLNPIGNDCSVNIQYDEVIQGGDFHINRHSHGAVAVDIIQVGLDVRIEGWSFVGKARNNDDLKRKLVLTDQAGKSLTIPIEHIERKDVWELFDKREDLKYAGFQVCIDKDKLALDVMKYRIGILTYILPGISILCYSDKMMDADELIENPLGFSKVEIAHNQERKTTEDTELVWSLDDCIQTEDVIKIRGFALLKEKDYYEYDVRLILKSSDIEYEIDTAKEKRYDVAEYYQDYPYAFASGFIAQIYCGELDMNQNYDILIELHHKYDRERDKVIDIGKKLK